MNKEALACLPRETDPLHVSVLDESSSLALQALRYMSEEGLVSSRNYDCVVQSAVRFHRPDLAWRLYEEMRERDFFPSSDTVSDLIYRYVLSYRLIIAVITFCCSFLRFAIIHHP